MKWRKNKCPQEVLTAYIFAELSDAEKVKIEKHLALCPACQTSLAQLRETVNCYPPGDLLPNADLITRTAREIVSVASAEKAPRFFVWPVWATASAVAVLLLFLMVLPRLNKPTYRDDALNAKLSKLENEAANLTSSTSAPTLLFPEEESSAQEIEKLNLELNKFASELENL